MTRKTTAGCENCGSTYQLTVWDLGFKESDSLLCPCCGETLLEWKKEPQAFFLSGTLKEGSIPIGAIESYVGRKIKIGKIGVNHVGILRGRGESLMATSPSSVERAWVLDTADCEVNFTPSEGWKISLA